MSVELVSCLWFLRCLHRKPCGGHFLSIVFREILKGKSLLLIAQMESLESMALVGLTWGRYLHLTLWPSMWKTTDGLSLVTYFTLELRAGISSPRSTGAEGSRVHFPQSKHGVLLPTDRK